MSLYLLRQILISSLQLGPVEVASPNPYSRPAPHVSTVDSRIPAPDSFVTTGSRESNTGSAWDRIRQQARSGQQKPGPEKSRPIAPPVTRGGTSSDGFSNFSSSAEKDRAAREAAQREFDARVEREREGGEFGSGTGGDQKRW